MKKYYKLALTGSLLLMTQASLAYCSAGGYLGVQVGGCNLDYQHSKLARDAISVEDNGFAGRLMAGFNFNPYVGLELGLTAYQSPEFKYDDGVTSSFSQSSLDMLAKLSLPVSCNLSMYAQGGLAYVHRGDAEVVNHNITIKVNEDDYHLRPMLGAGISYAFTSRISGNACYLRTFGAEDLPDASFYGVGLTFKVG